MGLLQDNQSAIRKKLQIDYNRHQVYSKKYWELLPKNHGIKQGRKAYSRDANGKIIHPTQTNIKKSKKIKDKENVNSAVQTS